MWTPSDNQPYEPHNKTYQPNCDEYIGQEQWETNTMPIMIAGVAVQIQMDVFLRFMDYTIVFNKLRHKKCWKC